MSIRRLLLTLWFWSAAAIGTILATFYIIFKSILYLQPIDHDLITYGIEKIMAPFIMMSMYAPGFWKVKYHHLYGYEKVRPPYILASNHNSMVDTLFIALLQYTKTYSYNYKYRFVPLFGQLCILADYVGIETNNPEQKSKVVETICKKVKSGYSIMIYPEGSRNKNPGSKLSIENIKTGAFRVAKETNTSIRPIYIHDSHKLMNRWGIIDIGEVEIFLLQEYKVENVKHGMEKFVELINKQIQ